MKDLRLTIEGRARAVASLNAKGDMTVNDLIDEVVFQCFADTHSIIYEYPSINAVPKGATIN